MKMIDEADAELIRLSLALSDAHLAHRETTLWKPENDKAWAEMNRLLEEYKKCKHARRTHAT